MEVRWSKRSVDNLKKIWRFYAEETMTAADRVVKGIKKKGDSLTPNILHQTEENLKPDQYRAVYRYFKIIYKVKNNQVWILQIFDARQDPKKLKS